MRRHRYIVAVALLAFLPCLLACGDRTPIIELPDESKDNLKENLINANRIIAESEETQINAYLQRRALSPLQLSDGVRCLEFNPNYGRQIADEDTVRLTYTLTTLTGQTIYKDQPCEVVVGRHQPTVGLDIALHSLHYGSHAFVVVPSAVGYGVAGDGDRVPARTVLCYDVSINP